VFWNTHTNAVSNGTFRWKCHSCLHPNPLICVTYFFNSSTLDRDSTFIVEIIDEEEEEVVVTILKLSQETQSPFRGMNVHAKIRLTNFALDPCCSSLVHLNYCWRCWSWQFSLVLLNCVFILLLLADDYLSFLASPHQWRRNSSYLSYSLILWIASHFFIRNYWKSIGNWSDKITWSSWVFYVHFFVQSCTILRVTLFMEVVCEWQCEVLLIY
jgi:hypothetical protein